MAGRASGPPGYRVGTIQRDGVAPGQRGAASAQADRPGLEPEGREPSRGPSARQALTTCDWIFRGPACPACRGVPIRVAGCSIATPRTAVK